MQTKIFLRFYCSKDIPKAVFSSLYSDQNFIFTKEYGNQLLKRQMRAYLIKEEGTLEMLASQKFEEDLQ